MLDKPQPYGFKFFILSGFIYDYEMYSGPVDMSDHNIQWK